ncbi:MAG: hypothetical protein FJ100_09810 [Deltaproteobacteria bacterium]|nr:hypothetical protein [Deltaproteobacteria bacterium]
MKRTILGLALVPWAVAAFAEPVLPPEAATAIQAVVDALHADARCVDWQGWTEVEVRSDRVVLRPLQGPGSAVLVHAGERPWLRLDVRASTAWPQGAEADACLARALQTPRTESIWKEAVATRDPIAAGSVTPRAATPMERTRSPTATWLWLATVTVGLSAMGCVALRRLVAAASGQ